MREFITLLYAGSVTENHRLAIIGGDHIARRHIRYITGKMTICEIITYINLFYNKFSSIRRDAANEVFRE